MEIVPAREEHLLTIQKIAFDTWPDTYGKLMSEEQFNFMMNWMYSLESLQKQLAHGQVFLLAREQNTEYGFVSYEVNYEGSSKTKIHKLYVLPSSQGKGVGKLLLTHIAEIARSKSNTALILNVKRDNPAVDFYQRVGFSITDTVDIDIGHGFMMHDFVLEKSI